MRGRRSPQKARTTTTIATSGAGSAASPGKAAKERRAKKVKVKAKEVKVKATEVKDKAKEVKDKAKEVKDKTEERDEAPGVVAVRKVQKNEKYYIPYSLTRYLEQI